MYRIGSVRRNREEGKEHIVLADLFDQEGNNKLSGPLEHVIRVCEERAYKVSNLEQAKAALKNMQG